MPLSAVTARQLLNHRLSKLILSLMDLTLVTDSNELELKRLPLQRGEMLFGFHFRFDML